jgi:hypothetical protein
MKTGEVPFLEKESIKGIIFSTLTKEYPLKLIDLMNIIHRRHGRSVTFQAVRKATMTLVADGVLEKKDKEYCIRKAWVIEAKRGIDGLYKDLSEHPSKPRHIEAAGEVKVFTFATVNEMMRFWESLVDDWHEHFRKGDPRINCYQAAHIWENLLHMDRESALMGQLKKKGIISYAVCTGSTPLDRSAAKLYHSLGLKIHLIPSSTSFDRSHYIGTYGDMIIEATYPSKVVKELDEFFRKNRSIEDLDLKELSEIVNQKGPVKLTVIKNRSMAEHINSSIISQFN